MADHDENQQNPDPESAETRPTAQSDQGGGAGQNEEASESDAGTAGPNASVHPESGGSDASEAPGSSSDRRASAGNAADSDGSEAAGDEGALLSAAQAAVSQAVASEAGAPDASRRADQDNPAQGPPGGQGSQAGAGAGDGGPDAAGAIPFQPPAFESADAGAGPGGIDLLADVNLDVQIELGRTRMLIEDVLSLGEGAVIELDKLAGDPVDVYVNDRLVARGEVLVLNDNFCVRINEIVDAGAVGQHEQRA